MWLSLCDFAMMSYNHLDDVPRCQILRSVACKTVGVQTERLPELSDLQRLAPETNKRRKAAPSVAPWLRVASRPQEPDLPASEVPSNFARTSMLYSTNGNLPETLWEGLPKGGQGLSLFALTCRL